MISGSQENFLKDMNYLRRELPFNYGQLIKIEEPYSRTFLAKAKEIYDNEKAYFRVKVQGEIINILPQTLCNYVLIYRRLISVARNKEIDKSEAYYIDRASIVDELLAMNYSVLEMDFLIFPIEGDDSIIIKVASNSGLHILKKKTTYPFGKDDLKMLLLANWVKIHLGYNAHNMNMLETQILFAFNNLDKEKCRHYDNKDGSRDYIQDFNLIGTDQEFFLETRCMWSEKDGVFSLYAMLPLDDAFLRV